MPIIEILEEYFTDFTDDEMLYKNAQEVRLFYENLSKIVPNSNY